LVWHPTKEEASSPAKGEVRNVSLLVAIAVNGEGYREILGICEGAKQDKAGWSAFLKHLKGRGLHGVPLIISDACMGLTESAGGGNWSNWSTGGSLLVLQFKMTNWTRLEQNRSRE
jgi:hypothetical protein